MATGNWLDIGMIKTDCQRQSDALERFNQGQEHENSA